MRSSCRNSCLLIIQLRNSDGLSMSWAEISWVWVDRHTQHSVNNEIFDQQALGFSELQQVRNQDEVELIFMFPLPPTFFKALMESLGGKWVRHAWRRPPLYNVWQKSKMGFFTWTWQQLLDGKWSMKSYENSKDRKFDQRSSLQVIFVDTLEVEIFWKNSYVLQLLMKVDGRVSMQNVITPLSIFHLLFATTTLCSRSKLRCTYFVYSWGDLMLITGNFLKHKNFWARFSSLSKWLNWLLWNS